MPANPLSKARLKRVFMEGFSVRDIAEPLVSFDASASAAQVRSLMEQRGFDVVGIRNAGVVCGYVKREELAIDGILTREVTQLALGGAPSDAIDGTVALATADVFPRSIMSGGHCENCVHPFRPEEVLSDSATLPMLVVKLAVLPRLFVTAFDQVGGIVTRADLQKPPVRMWLFGMITFIEMGLTGLIAERLPGDAWMASVSDGRLAKARELLEERKRRNQDLSLLDCLQLADKAQIVLRREDLRKEAGFRSRSRGEQTMKEIEALRNNLAHSQDIITCDWEIIVKLTEYLDMLFEE